MTERGIIFSAPMIRALLAGTKSQTRRAIAERDLGPIRSEGADLMADGLWYWRAGKIHYQGGFRCPYGVPGDRLWVRETFRVEDGCSNESGRNGVHYRADDEPGDQRWTSPIYMPRWASRLILELTEVRVQRLQEISEADAKAEGVEPQRIGTVTMSMHETSFTPTGTESFRQAYQNGWDKLNAKRCFPWAANPWVWALSFRKVEP